MVKFNIVKCKNCGKRNIVISWKSKKDKNYQWNCCDKPDVEFPGEEG